MARQSSREPCSMNRSGMPICSSGSAMPASASSSPTADPAPPATTFSSMVQSARDFSATPQHCLAIHWFDEAHVQHGGVMIFGGSQRRRQQRPERQDRKAAAPFASRHCTPIGRAVISPVDLDAGAGTARIAHRRRLLQRGGGVQHLPALVLVRWCHHHHVRNAAQEADVETALVRGAIAAHQARAIQRENHRQLLQGDVVDQLVIATLQVRSNR